MRYTKYSFPFVLNKWFTPYGMMDEEGVELYCEELNNGVTE